MRRQNDVSQMWDSGMCVKKKKKAPESLESRV